MEVALQLTDNASLRGLEGEDGKWHWSVYDFINFVTGHEPGDCYGKKTFYRIVKDGSEHAKEVGTNCHYFQFPGQGQKSTPCMTVRGLQRLLMILGGKVAAEFREIVEGSRHSSPWPHTHFTKANKKTNKTKALIQEHFHTRARWKLPCS
jgi:hypothetical protein